MRKARALLRKDMLTVFRNRLMLLLIVVPPVFAGVMRIILVKVAKRYVSWLPPDVEVLFAPLVAMMPGYLVGTAAGFGLVTERETRAAVSLRVMPVSGRLFSLYQSGWQAILAMLLAPLCLWVFGVPPASWAEALIVIAALSLGAGLLAFMLGSLAANRIEALAVSKMTGVLLLTPVAVFLAPPAVQLVVAWSPWYWAYVGLLGAIAGNGAAAVSLVRWPGYSPLAAAAACLITGLGWTFAAGRRYHRLAD